MAAPVVEVKTSVQEHTAPSHELFNTIYNSNVVNFIFVLLFVVWLCKKFNIAKAIADQRDAIIATIRAAEEKKVKAELELDAVEKKIRRSEDEVSKIIENSKDVAESLSDRIFKETESSIEEIVQRSHRTIESERESAKSVLNRQVTNAAFAVSEEHIKNSIDEHLHTKYINEFIDGLSNLKV